MKSPFTNDIYKKSRGGYSRLLEITCEKCNGLICLYQKDGPGNLRRLYIDRIKNSNVKLSKKELSCNEGHILGIKTTYEKENRTAYRLFVDAVIKKITNSDILLKNK